MHIIKANKRFDDIQKLNLGHYFLRLISLFKILNTPVLVYASQAWAVTKSDESLGYTVSERKILRRIYGAEYMGQCPSWHNLFKEPGIFKFIKINTWNGLVM
jgi:hypothetical protein